MKKKHSKDLKELKKDKKQFNSDESLQKVNDGSMSEQPNQQLKQTPLDQQTTDYEAPQTQLANRNDDKSIGDGKYIKISDSENAKGKNGKPS